MRCPTAKSATPTMLSPHAYSRSDFLQVNLFARRTLEVEGAIAAPIMARNEGESARPFQRCFSILAALATVVALSSCDLPGSHSWQWDQKITIRVMTKEGERVGSSVQRVSWHESPVWARLGDSGGWFSNELTGEAAVVEVRPGKYLFALLKTYDGPANAKIFGGGRDATLASASGSREQLRAENDRLEMLVEAHEIPPPLYPTLVTFSDVSNSATIQLVDPLNLSASFGPDVSLSSITLSITNEPLTEGRIEQVLPWFYVIDTLIPRHKSPRLERDGTQRERVGRFDFITGNLWRKK